MAKVTITFEDIEEGVSVRIESDPIFPELNAQTFNNLTEAQQMGLRMSRMLSEELAEIEEHENAGKGCCGGEAGVEGEDGCSGHCCH